MRISRRAVLLGGTAACIGARAATPNASLVGPLAAEHWSVRYTGVAPEAMFVQRGPLASPGYLFHDRWIHGRFVCDLFDVRKTAPQVELFSYPKINDLTVIRGMGARPAPVGGGCFALVGRAPSGVVEYAGPVYGDMRLFVLPDGTWVVGVAPALDHLGADLATAAVTPPVCNLEPDASLAQQDVGHQLLSASHMIPDGLVGREAVLARTIALFPGPHHARPLLVKFHFPTNEQAEAAAASASGLLRSGAARDDAWSSPSKDLAGFMASVTEARAEGSALVLVGGA